MTARLGIGRTEARKYFSDGALRDPARNITFEIVEEAPGGKMLGAPRDRIVPLGLVHRVVTGLSYAAGVRLAEREDLSYVRESVAQILGVQADLGVIAADQRAEEIGGDLVLRLPQPLLHRLARCLETAALLADAGVPVYGGGSSASEEIATGLRWDAERLRRVADPTRPPHQ